MPTQMGCVVCSTSHCERMGQNGDRIAFNCEVCGRYDVSGSAFASVLNPESYVLTPVQRAVLSHRVRQANDAGRDPPLLTTYDVEEVIENGRLPSPAQQATNIIRFVGNRITPTGNAIRELPLSFHSSVGSHNRNFALRIAKQLRQEGLLTAIDCGNYEAPDDIMEIDLTLRGWERYEAEQHGQISGNYGFIALKFGDPVLDPFVSNVIKPTVSTLGYELVDMRDAAEAGIIDNVMRARIRDAAFVLVDLTHANEGAYWESGYAEGLGKPVLYLCNKAVFDEHRTHFDTNHCTTVKWDVDHPETFQNELLATLRRSLGLFAS